MLLVCGAWAQETIALPQPEKTGGMSLMEALDRRATDRGPFDGEALTVQELSNLLWAAWGVNRAGGGRTAPSANNSQEIDLYLFTREGGYRYDAADNALTLICSGDYRKEVVTRGFGETAVDIFFVANLDKRSGDAEARRLMSATDSGYISQNIYLYCASQGWGTVVYHGSLDRDKVTTLLGLQPNQWVVGGQSVGRRK
jgi:nitroreductase